MSEAASVRGDCFAEHNAQTGMHVRPQLSSAVLANAPDQGTPGGRGEGSVASTRCARHLKEVDTNGGRPDAHSYSTQPSAQRSLALLCTPPDWNSSGAMYVGVACAQRGSLTGAQAQKYALLTPWPQWPGAPLPANTARMLMMGVHPVGPPPPRCEWPSTPKCSVRDLAWGDCSVGCTQAAARQGRPCRGRSCGATGQTRRA